MAKNCMLYETLGKVSDLQIQESASNGEVRLSGVFGVCGVRNNNKRVYSKENYGMMVEALQNVIKTEGCPGELEHPNTMNITLENVSHKIEEIHMNENGTVEGTVLLLDTPKGKIAKAIVKGGLPLYISSRGAGSIDENGNVTLTTIKTYDLVGTPGFSQAKLNLKENQTYESLNESLADGNIMFAIVEEEDDEKSDNPLLEKPSKDKEDKSKESEKEDVPSGASETDDNDEQNNSDDIDMKDLKEAIDKLTEKVTSLEAELHVAKESQEELEDRVANIKETNYAAIEQWICEEFAPEFKSETINEMAGYVEGWICEEFAPEVQNWVCEEFAPEVQNWVCEEFAPEVQNWVCEEFAPEVQNWVCEEFAPEVQNWICEEFAPEVQNWICEEFAPEVQNWICEEFAPEVEGWICEEFAVENNANLENKINENVSAFLESQKDNQYDAIDKMLEAVEKLDSNDAAIASLAEAQKADTTFAGYYAIENMPAQYRPSWEMLTESRKIEIARSSKMYDYTKPGMVESFWAGVKFVDTPVNESVQFNIAGAYQKSVADRMMAMRH